MQFGLLLFATLVTTSQPRGNVLSIFLPQLGSTSSKDDEQIRNQPKHEFSNEKWFPKFVGGPPSRKRYASEQELELTHFLFTEQGYNPLIRPVANESDTVRVDLGLCMIQIIQVEEKRQVMKSNVWLPMVWRDYQLTWDPAKYGGIEVFRVPHNRVWKPDIVLFNNADGNYEVIWQPNMLIHYDGSILWMPPAVYESSCAIDVEYFPFDEQECEMKFGSWVFDANRVSLGWYRGHQYVDLSDYWKSGSWDLVDVPGKIVNTTSGGVNHTNIIYTIKLRRKTLFYTVNLISPCVMISILSVFVFYLPADAGEKVTLAISIVVALVVFLILVSKILPPTSISVPLISRYLLFTFLFDVFSVLISVVIVNWNYRSPRTHTMSNWTRLLFLKILPRLLCMRMLQISEENNEAVSYCSQNVPTVYETNIYEHFESGSGVESKSSFATSVSLHENEDAFEQSFQEGELIPPLSSMSNSCYSWSDENCSFGISEEIFEIPPRPARRSSQLSYKISTHTTETEINLFSRNEFHSYENLKSSCLTVYDENDELTSSQSTQSPASESSRPPSYLSESGCSNLDSQSGYHDSRSIQVNGLPKSTAHINVSKNNFPILRFDQSPRRIGRNKRDGSQLGSSPDSPYRERFLKASIRNQHTHLGPSCETLINNHIDAKKISLNNLPTTLKPISFEKIMKSPNIVANHTDREQLQTLLQPITRMKEGILAINYISERLEECRKIRLVVQEWKYVASVIDRLMLIIFSVITLVVSLSLLTNAPSFLSSVDQDAVIRNYSLIKRR